MIIRKLTVIAIALVAMMSPALAQTTGETAPRIDSQSPGGVSYGTGGFSYDFPALSIGDGDFPRSLKLVLQYRSDGARLPNTAWASSLAVRTSVSRYDPLGLEFGCPPYCHPGDYTYSYNIVAGQRSDAFYTKGPSGGGGPYQPLQQNGASLVWNGGSSYTYTSSDGAVLSVAIPISGSAAYAISSWTEPDGTTVTYNLSASGGSISTNRGVALFFESPSGSAGNYTQKVCALNLATYYLPSISNCPALAATVTLAGPSLNGSGGGVFNSITDSTSGVTQFSYGTSGRGSDGHLQCIQKPGYSGCWLTNTYDTCDAQGAGQFYDASANGSRDRVTNQTYSTGEAIGYTYVSVETDQFNGECRGNRTTTMTRAGAQTQVTVSGNWRGGFSRTPNTIVDPLSRTSSLSYSGDVSDDYADLTRPGTFTWPMSNSVQYSYDTRGNVTETRLKPKPGSGLSDVVSSATYPVTCTYAVSCNKPLTTTDANGNVTTYTYDNTHGGVLSKVGPAVNGVSAANVYYYAQRYAWIKNASGGFSHAASSVWVLTEERTCRTSALNVAAGTCVAGSNDLVDTAYDYGPDTGAVGNNLWLRGVAVTADGTTLRTCYGYDANGNRIWETKPNAGLATCY